MLQAGDHIKVNRKLYWHHGIYCGNNEVIHYTPGADGGVADMLLGEGVVCLDSLDSFADGSDVKVVHYKSCADRRVVLRRARGRLGEREYNLVTNNCEHFATWCKTGSRSSQQVNTGVRTAAKSVAPHAAKALVKHSSKEGLKQMARSNVASNIVFGLAELTVDTVRYANGSIDKEEFQRNTAGNVSSTGGAIGGAAIGTAICPGVGTVIGGFLGGILGGQAGRSLF